MESCGLSDPGLVRENNEDSWYIDPDLHLAIVADGMGGAACGEIASKLTLETVVTYIRTAGSSSDPVAMIREGIREANQRVLERARHEAVCVGMGSTIVAAFWRLPVVCIANVGDSRAYLWRAGTLTQLSYDQTLVNELRHALGVSEEEVKNYPNRDVLTMAIGSGEVVRVETNEQRLCDGDVVLLCSDGLTHPVCERAIAAVLARHSELQECANQLLGRAKEAGGPDNITLVLLRYHE